MTTELDKKQETALAKPKKRGFEEPTQREDLLMPRAKLLQALSPEVVESGDKFQAGQIINSLTREILPDVFIPIFKFTFWMRFNPRNAKDPRFDGNYGPGDMMWRSSDPFDPRVDKEGKFGPGGERPLATKFLNFFSFFPGVKMPVIVSFSNTSFKAGKRLLSLAQFSDADMFSRKYSLKCKSEKNDIGTFFVFTVDPSGIAEGEDLKAAEQWWTDFHERTKEIQVHDEGNKEAAATEDADGRPF